MRRPWFLTASAAAALTLVATAAAQAPVTPGFVSFSLAGLGGTTTMEGESRLPVLPRDATHANGTLRVHASSRRAVVRDLALTVNGAGAGRRYEFGARGEATLVVQFDSGRSEDADLGWVELDQVDGAHATGTFEATLTRGRVPLTMRGRFEARFARP